MKTLIAFGLMVLSSIALGQDDVSGVLEASEGIGSIFLPMLPPGATETLAIVFASVGAVNAVSIVLEKIAEKTTTEKDDKAVAKLKKGVVFMQKFVNFFIAKR